jgi:3-hydroxybutyryl-CoA dehydratase
MGSWPPLEISGGTRVNKTNGYDIEDIKVGMAASFAKTITEADIILFAGASGDKNDIHINDEFGRGTAFGGRIAHGFLTASVISAGTIYVSQQINFRASVRPGDTAHADVVVKEIIQDRDGALLETVCRIGETIVIGGEAIVKATSATKHAAKVT